MNPRERALLVILSQAGEWVPLAELRSRGLGDIAMLASNAVAQGWVEYGLRHVTCASRIRGAQPWTGATDMPRRGS
ncbi:hypothetical protein Mnod_8511 (plasmid) [Methylobacterium nodulans ORS 2060]|uniref:Uncharacterized protein n=1 Tax=Methylobacterium nodulans (strain LMG 21967 / CNCM I-2342 / ORS 2060) TaxID=460265 RepID=B8IW17_METNO|nr:hypothetical protein Mnod_8511 [Methylobacterium nodulans ORS 2060]